MSAEQQKTTENAPSLDPAFRPLIQLLAEVRMRIIREAVDRRQADQS
jgi:hypothetical protein